MPLVMFTWVILLGTAINDYNSGGTKDFDEAVEKIERVFDDSTPDYTNLND